MYQAIVAYQCVLDTLKQSRLCCQELCQLTRVKVASYEGAIISCLSRRTVTAQGQSGGWCNACRSLNCWSSCIWAWPPTMVWATCASAQHCAELTKSARALKQAAVAAAVAAAMAAWLVTTPRWCSCWSGRLNNTPRSGL